MSEWMPPKYHYDISECPHLENLEAHLSGMGKAGWRLVQILTPFTAVMELPQPPKEPS